MLAPPVAALALIPRQHALPWARLGIAAWVTFCVLLLFCGAMTRAVTYDEDQYVAAGVMARFLLPYRDFTYLQAPLYPLVLAPLFGLAQGWFMLMARLLSFGLALCSGLLLWHLVRRLGAGLVLAMILLTACLASPFLLSTLANTRNDGLPLALLLAGLAVHLWSEERGNQAGATQVFAARVLAALLFGLAVEAKVSYVFAPAILALHALSAPRSRLVPAMLGLGAAALPAVFFYVVAPEAFLFGLVGYHLTAPVAWYTGAGMADLLTPWARVQALGGFAVLGGNLTLILLSGALALVAMARCSWRWPGGMLVALTAGATGLALLPAPSWAMYYAATAPLLACCIAHLAGITTHLTGVARRRILLTVAVLPTLPFLLLQTMELPQLLDLSHWVGFVVHHNAQAIRDALGENGAAGGEVATLFPSLVIDANPVRPEFASGPFVFRSGASFAPGVVARMHALSPETLEQAFAAGPPDAIYAGRYAAAWPVPMDAPLAAYAERHGWRLIRTDNGGGRLWLRPR